MKKFLNILRNKIRNWLGITDPTTYMAVDLGYRDATCLVLMRKGRNETRDLVEIVNFPAGTPLADIQEACRDLAYKYGVRSDNFIQDSGCNPRVELSHRKSNFGKNWDY